MSGWEACFWSVSPSVLLVKMLSSLGVQVTVRGGKLKSSAKITSNFSRIQDYFSGSGLFFEALR